MDVVDVWRVIDEERSTMADLLEELTDEEWERPSLCTAWRVRDVAAHLTLAQMGWAPAALAFLRSGGSFNRMIRDTALRQARLPVEEYPTLLRAMVGSRRKAPLVSPIEPMLDLLVHGQDIAVPLGRRRPMRPDAAAAAATRAWAMNWPFRTRGRLHGLQLVAADVSWTAGTGLLVRGPIADLLLLVTGRPVDATGLTGPGVERLRLQPASRKDTPGPAVGERAARHPSAATTPAPARREPA